MHFLNKCTIIQSLMTISIVLTITPVEAGRHKNGNQDIRDHKQSRKIKNKQADDQYKKQEGYKKTSKLIPYAIAHSYNLDFTTPKGMGVGLLLATYVVPAAAYFDDATKTYLKCKQGNHQKFLAVKTGLIQKQIFQGSGPISGLIIAHEASFLSSEARTELFQWAASKGAKTLYMADAPNAYAQEILTDIQRSPMNYASMFEEDDLTNPVCKQSKKKYNQLKKDWSQVHHALEIYQADKLNLDIIGIDNFRESKEELYIYKLHGDKEFCNKITKEEKFCNTLTKDRALCKKIAYDHEDEGFCDRIIALTGNKDFYENNKMNKEECAGMHPSTEIRELYFGQALDELFNKSNDDFVLVAEPINMIFFDKYFKNKENFNVQFIWTGPSISLVAMEQALIELKKRERAGICPKGSPEDYKNGLNFVRNSLQYRPDLCNLP